MFGREHPDVMIEILGEFPAQDTKMAFPMSLFNFVGTKMPFSKQQVKTINLGVDIAGEGGDLIVFTANYLNYDYDRTQERQFLKPKEFFTVLDSYGRANYNISRDRLIQQAKSIIKEYSSIPNGVFKMLYINIDATGVGSAFLDAVREALEKNTTLVNGHELRK